MCEYFGRTDLGKVYEKCTTDNRLRFLFSSSFDIKNGFDKYENAGVLEMAHEAAYDVFMTGVAFAHMIRYKEPGNESDKSQ